MSKNIKNTVPYAYAINNVNGEEIVKTFYEKEVVERVIKIKGDKLYVK